MGILTQPTWFQDSSSASPPAQWESVTRAVSVALLPYYGAFTGSIQYPLGTPIELSATDTPEVPGDQYFANVVLLLHNDTSGFVDSSSYARAMDYATYSVGFDTSIKKFGAGSGSFNFGTTTLFTLDAPELDFSTGDWTTELWVYAASAHAGYPRPIIQKRANNGGGSAYPFIIHIDDTGHLLAAGTDNTTTLVYSLDGGDFSANYDTWTAVELDRHGDTFTLRVNGTTVATQTASGVLDNHNYDLMIGGWEAVGQNLGGNIDELRITRGVARYTTDYTPAVAEFYNAAPIPAIPGAVPGGFTADTVYYVVSGGAVNPLTFALAATPGGAPIVATNTGTNVVATDERYTFLSADAQIAYDNQLPLMGTARIAYQTITHASAGALDFEYNIGAGPVDVALTNTDGAVGIVSVCLEGATQFVWGLKSGSTGAVVAFQETAGDTTVTGANFNCSCPEENDFDTLSTLRDRMMRRLGFAASVNNPPPGMSDLLTEFLQSAQKELYKRYPARFTRRLFRWTMNQGQRFFGVKANDDDTYRNLRLDFTKGIEWSGIQDGKGTWTPIFEGIMPELYTMVTQLGRPVRYEVRECIEVFPAPDGPYSLWLKANITLQPFAADSDQTTIDSEVVFLHALSTAKAHYGQADAQATQAMANSYLGELCAGTHVNKRYIPGAHPIAPIVKPALITFQDGS